MHHLIASEGMFCSSSSQADSKSDTESKVPGSLGAIQGGQHVRLAARPSFKQERRQCMQGTRGML